MTKKQVAFIIFFIIFCACNVIYAKYILTNEIAINMTTQPFYFEANVDNQTIEFDGTEGYFNLNETSTPQHIISKTRKYKSVSLYQKFILLK